MRCTNRRCRKQTERRVCVADKKGKTRWGCPSCTWMFKTGHSDRKVRTGRKIWHSYEVYGVKKTIEKNQEWISKTAERAAKNRKETGCISEGAYGVLVQESERGRLRPRVDGRPAR